MDVWQKTLKERFLKKIQKCSETGCWIWTASKAGKGYGQIGTKRGEPNKYAHRVSYEIYVGEIPKGKFVCHKCDNPSCVNPKHLFLATQKENMSDMRKKGRGTMGNNHPNAVLTFEIAQQIRSEYKTGDTSLSKLGKKYGIVHQHVHDIVKNKIWRKK